MLWPSLMRHAIIAGLVAFLVSVTVRADEIHFLEHQCRVLDTRNLGGPVANGTEYGIYVRGQVGHTQGGAANCGLPIEASGAVINVTAVTALGSGHLEVYRTGHRPPEPTSRLNYGAGQTVANEMIVRLTQPFSSSQPSELTFRPGFSPTHLVVDLIGYTEEPFPTFPIVLGRIVNKFQFQAVDESEVFWHLMVETNPGGNCSTTLTCHEIECSNQPGAGEVCEVSTIGGCIEIQGYRRPYSSPQWSHLADRHMVATIVRLFAFPPCPWE